MSQVKRNIKRVLAVDPAVTRIDIRQYDRIKIKEFKEFTEFKNNVYYVDLRLYEDKINYLPSDTSKNNAVS